VATQQVPNWLMSTRCRRRIVQIPLKIMNNVQVDLMSIKFEVPANELRWLGFMKIADSIMSCSATLQHVVLSNFRFYEFGPSLRHGLLVIIRDLSSAIRVLWRHLNAEKHLCNCWQCFGPTLNISGTMRLPSSLISEPCASMQAAICACKQLRSL
jgi:hypothetical protein